MLSHTRTWASLGLLLLGGKGTFGDDHHAHSTFINETIVVDPTYTSGVTEIDTTTILASTTVPVTHYVDVTVSHYVNVTISSTEVVMCTESTTTTLHYTVSVTETDSATVTTTETDLATVTTTETDLATVTTTETDSATVTTTETDSATITNTETDSATITNTETDSATITNTETTTTTVPATITTYTTQTIFSTTYDPCPKSCSISVETVNLFFWPTDRPYFYPATYVDTSLDYTFVSPSVYMLIPTARGINTLGQPAGPSTTSWMLPLDLDEVSTIVGGSITSQLHLSDLGTDCAQTADPTAIATMVDSRCDPILAAPKEVSSWAYPCNACGRFGLFDPPYAVPTLTGGLLGTTMTTATPAPVSTVTAAPSPTSVPPVGTLLVVYYSDGTAVATATITTTGVSGTITSSIMVSATAVATSVSSAVVSTSAEETTESSSPSATAPLSTSSTTPVVSTSTSLSTSTSTSTTPATAPLSTPSTTPMVSSSSTFATTTPTSSVVTASAARVTGGFVWLISSVFAVTFIL